MSSMQVRILPPQLFRKSSGWIRSPSRTRVARAVVPRCGFKSHGFRLVVVVQMRVGPVGLGTSLPHWSGGFDSRSALFEESARWRGSRDPATGLLSGKDRSAGLAQDLDRGLLRRGQRVHARDWRAGKGERSAGQSRLVAMPGFEPGGAGSIPAPAMEDTEAPVPGRGGHRSLRDLPTVGSGALNAAMLVRLQLSHLGIACEPAGSSSGEKPGGDSTGWGESILFYLSGSARSGRHTVNVEIGGSNPL